MSTKNIFLIQKFHITPHINPRSFFVKRSQFMEIHSNKENLQPESWLDCIGDLVYKNYLLIPDETLNKEDSFFVEQNHKQTQFQQIKQNTSVQTQILKEKDEFQQQKFKRQRINIFQEDEPRFQVKFIEDYDSEKIESKEQQKTQKIGKYSQYSKNYRQRKKQKIRILEEQNNYLKQKVNQLQQRLREKQLQLNRIKHPPIEKDFSVQQLNEQFIKKANLLLSKSTTEPQHYNAVVVTAEDKIYNEFMSQYEEHGFGGTRKQKILNYYFNQMLETILRDSQKYLFLICNKSNSSTSISGLQSYEQINLVFREVIDLDQNKGKRLQYFSTNLFPYMKELKNICAQIYMNFNKILDFINRVQNFMKSSYLTNMDLARKRIQLENWFENNKHSKLLRKLRSQWLDFVKEAAQNEYKQKNEKKGSKKNKLSLKNQAFLK